MSFESFLRLIREGDPVQAGRINRPLRQIDQNVRYLWDVLQAAGTGSTVYARRQSVEPEVQQGMAVWYNHQTFRFERGLAQAETDPATGRLRAADTARVWGIVADKINATLADILLFGLDDVDISAAIEGALPAEPGDYYLSARAAGALTRDQPPVAVPVLRATPDGKVFVTPRFVDALDRHTHYCFRLVCAPAGSTSPPPPGGRHVITDPDPSLRGWLPADHASFLGKAPPGAVFGYNLAAEPALQHAWPPQPIDQAYLEWDRGLDATVGATGVPLGPHGLCLLDRHGIWWLSDCHGDVPWPTDYQTGVSHSLSDSVTPECPRRLHMAMTLWFTRSNFVTDATSVLSLHSGDQRIKVRCYGEERAASTGHLELFLDLHLAVAENAAGHHALKEFDPETAEFRRGPLVEGVYGLSGNVTLAANVPPVPRTIQGVERQVYQGLVGIAVTPAETKELEVQLVRLAGAEEEHFHDLMFISFRPGVQEEYRAKVQVPSDLSLPAPRMRLRFSVLARAAGTLPQLVFSARRVPRPPAGLTAPLPLPTGSEEFAVTCNTQGVLATANQYVEAESEPFPVAPGETVYFTVRRLATDGFPAEVGILRQVGIVTAGS
jgi:hypothetical protein